MKGENVPHVWSHKHLLSYSLMQKNGYTFATVYSSKCESVFLHRLDPSIVDGKS